MPPWLHYYHLKITLLHFFLICNIFFFQDHIQEVLNKWQSIDDEIWAKIIVLERNRRVAKAYARAPVLTVNGSDDGFDGFRIGLAGFDNPMRDAKTEEVKRHIGQVLLCGIDIRIFWTGDLNNCKEDC